MDGGEQQRFTFTSDRDHESGWLLDLGGGQAIENPLQQLGADEEPDDLDVGLRLLEPVTSIELSAIEAILGELQRAHSAGDLTERQQLQIMTLADSIRTTRNAAEPDETPRWKIVGAVGVGLTYLFEKFPSGVIKWIDLSTKLEEMGWGNLADEIRSLIENLPT